MKNIVSAEEILKKAFRGKYAIPQFNINNLEWTKAILEESQLQKSPVILGASEGATKYMGGFNVVVNMIKGLVQDLKITIPVIIHLDHGSSFDSAKKAIDAGFTSVMYDGSLKSIEENVKQTKRVVKYAHLKKVSVEAEVGTVGGDEDGLKNKVNYATLEDVKLIAKTGIDFLAASLGSVHGHYQGKPKLGFSEMKIYSKTINLPLVLHGGSGISDRLIKKAIASGESKININTELQEAYIKGIRKYISEKKDLKDYHGYDPRKLNKTYAIPFLKKEIRHKITLFGSKNKA